MKQISVNSIEKAIDKIDNLDDDQLEEVSEAFALSQPILLGYILSAAEEYENEQLEGLLIYYFCLISETFVQEQVEVKEVEEADIEAFEEPFFDMLDEFFEKDDDDIIDEFCEQPDLYRFMIAEVSTEDEDGTTLDEETSTQLFIVTLALITLLSRSQKD